MGDCKGSLDDEVDPFVGIGQLDDGVRGVKGADVIVDLHQGGVAPRDDHGGRVEVPLEEIVVVEADGGVLLSLIGGRADGLRDVRDQVAEVLVQAVETARVAVGTGGRGGRGRVAVV